MSDIDARDENTRLTEQGRQDAAIIDGLTGDLERLRAERDAAIKSAAPGLASLAELTDEIGRQVDSGEFASGLVIEKDVVGRCVLAWAKHSMGDRVDGCRVLVTAPVAILLRPVDDDQGPDR